MAENASTGAHIEVEIQSTGVVLVVIDVAIRVIPIHNRDWWSDVARRIVTIIVRVSTAWISVKLLKIRLNRIGLSRLNGINLIAVWRITIRLIVGLDDYRDLCPLSQLEREGSNANSYVLCACWFSKTTQKNYGG
jgi:hypothetical protein